jgi:hypothetical protein
VGRLFEGQKSGKAVAKVFWENIGYLPLSALPRGPQRQGRHKFPAYRGLSIAAVPRARIGIETPLINFDKQS